MKNYVSSNESITMPAPSGGVTAGTPFLSGVMLGVPAATAAVGELVAVYVRGQFILAKATGQAWTVGAAVFWDDTAKNCTTTASGNTRIGHVAAAAASGDTTGRVLLAPMA